ncbi:MAG: hypothetical protein IKF90_12025, partial [Parasporobacterium sp.]|nr:hypothetical protein [Parasporobacterium sp.]
LDLSCPSVQPLFTLTEGFALFHMSVDTIAHLRPVEPGSFFICQLTLSPSGMNLFLFPALINQPFR